MNILNEKARILRIQIESEKGADNPNLDKIKALEKELNSCLEELIWK